MDKKRPGAYQQMIIEGLKELSRKTIFDIPSEPNATKYYRDGLYDAYRLIKSLPPAEQALTCDGCRHQGTYDTEFPCSDCIRREKDNYEPEE